MPVSFFTCSEGLLMYSWNAQAYLHCEPKVQVQLMQVHPKQLKPVSSSIADSMAKDGSVFFPNSSAQVSKLQVNISADCSVRGGLMLPWVYCCMSANQVVPLKGASSPVARAEQLSYSTTGLPRDVWRSPGHFSPLLTSHAVPNLKLVQLHQKRCSPLPDHSRDSPATTTQAACKNKPT